MTAFNDVGESNISDNLTSLAEFIELMEKYEKECFKPLMDMNKNYENFQDGDAGTEVNISLLFQLLSTSDVEDVKSVCKFLIKIIIIPKHAKKFIDEDGITKLLKLLDVFNDDTIYEYVIDIFNEISKTFIEYKIVIPYFVKILQNSTNINLCLKAAKTLDHLATRNKDAKHLLLTRKNIPFFISLLNPSNVLMAKYGCRALYWYSSDRYIDEIVEKGAIPKLIKLLYAPNFDLIEAALRNLEKICTLSAFGEEDAVEAGIIPLLAKILSAFNQRCCEIAASILCHISEGVKKVKDGIVNDAEAIPNLLKCLNSSNSHLCLNALSTFKNLSNGTQKHRESLAKAGVITNIINLLSSISTSKKNNKISLQKSKTIECASDFLANMVTKDTEIFLKEIDYSRLHKFLNLIEAEYPEQTKNFTYQVRLALDCKRIQNG